MDLTLTQQSALESSIFIVLPHNLHLFLSVWILLLQLFLALMNSTATMYNTQDVDVDVEWMYELRQSPLCPPRHQRHTVNCEVFCSIGRCGMTKYTTSHSSLSGLTGAIVDITSR